MNGPMVIDEPTPLFSQAILDAGMPEDKPWHYLGHRMIAAERTQRTIEIGLRAIREELKQMLAEE